MKPNLALLLNRYESAEPLARLYSPLFHTDDTFILQEYFLPITEAIEWMKLARGPLLGLQDHAPAITLLNVTIRFVEKDTYTLLPYARNDDGVYSFVLYYRITRDSNGDGCLKNVHDTLVKQTLDLGGTFYLPYRLHYTRQEVRFWIKFK